MPVGTPPNGFDTSAVAAAARARSGSTWREAVQVGRVDRGERGVELLDRRALAAAERVDERAGITGQGASELREDMPIPSLADPER